MITDFKIEGFKSLRINEFKFGKMNILSGLNGSGKSSLIQAIRMASSFVNGNDFYIKGHGMFDELKSRPFVKDGDIKLSLINQMLNKNNVSISDKIEIIATQDKVTKNIRNKAFNFEYLSADRFGPMATLPTLYDANSEISIGSRGEYSASYYELFESLIIDSNLLYDGTTARLLKEQLDNWIGEISPGAEVLAKVDKKHDVSSFEINGFRANNTGFGISYSLPILLTCLAMTSKIKDNKNVDDKRVKRWLKRNSLMTPILLLENPEAHIHPRGQTALAQFLAKVSMCGMQIIVETHSEHFVDGARIAVKNGILPPSDLTIHYFEKSQNDGSITSSIECDGNGRLDNWPAGFFDQSLINLRELSRK